MSDSAVLHFLPWMRRGLVRALASEADARGVPRSDLATVDAAVTVGGTEVARAIRLRGPGAVVGLNASQVVREEPRAGTTDFETNYFPAVELASPDLPWQLTPAAPNGERLIPWLVLAVVEERQGITFSAKTTGPLPVLDIADRAGKELPPLAEAWAWAHVQATVDPADDVDAAFRASPEAFIARLVCPRVLVEDTWYRACLVPSFEQGRQAGLGMTVSASATQLAWSDSTEALSLPVYHSFRFRTSKHPGDFESLVKKLRARTLEGSVGVHDLDIGTPGSARLPEAPGTIVGFQGALVSPNVAVPVWPAEHEQAFEKGLRTMLNEVLAASGSEPAPGDYVARRDDPAVAPPAYGALPAGVDEVPRPAATPSGARPAWLSEVNLEPPHRAAAGLGAEVVRRNQEALVASAWDQAAALRDVNRTLNRARLALEVGKRMKLRVDAMEGGARLQLTRGAHGRLKRADMATTVHGRILESELPSGLVSGAMRRHLRQGTTIAKASEGSRTPTVVTPTLTSGLTAQFLLNPQAKLQYAALTVPRGTVIGEAVEEGGTSRRDLATFARATARSGPPPTARRLSSVPVAVDLGGAGALALTDLPALVSEKLDPSALLRVRVRALVAAPQEAWTDEDVPASMTFSPSYPDAAYELLARIDPELMMPGVSSIPDDTVALANLNEAFVEAFLLGANDELGRELVWREAPVDPADTWMRTFWDKAGADVEDIDRIADWDDEKPLGEHPPSGGIRAAQVLVLIVKGQLLRRYPSTLVHAVRARWDEDVDEATGETVWERVEDEDAEALWPIFVGSLGRDVMFLGFQFDATVDVDVDVSGSPERAAGKPGWFFVFEQPVTEPRFGLDVGRSSHTGTGFRYWKNVSWYEVLGEADSAKTHAPLGPLDGVTKRFDEPDPDRDDENDWTETWGRDAAAQARITLQRPVRMLVHADQMLEPTEEDG